jgi:hypothetical protein
MALLFRTWWLKPGPAGNLGFTQETDACCAKAARVARRHKTIATIIIEELAAFFIVIRFIGINYVATIIRRLFSVRQESKCALHSFS